MNSSCARTDALMRRLLGDDEVAAPTDEERQHAASCPACRSVIEHSARLDGIFTSHFAAVRATAPKIRFVFPPQASADAATAAGWRAWCEQLLTGWFGPERLRLAAAVGAVVIVAVLAGGLSLLRGHFGSDERGVGASGASAAVFQVAGRSGEITGPDGRARPLSREGVTVADAVGWHLTIEHEAAVQLPSGGRIVVEGRGSLQLTPRGFGSPSGHFVADFGKHPDGYEVGLPAAVLAIRGTRIRFALDGGVGELELLAGAVTVTPSRPEAPAFAWPVGERLRVTADHIERVAGGTGAGGVGAGTGPGAAAGSNPVVGIASADPGAPASASGQDGF